MLSISLINLVICAILYTRSMNTSRGGEYEYRKSTVTGTLDFFCGTQLTLLSVYDRIISYAGTENSTRRATYDKNFKGSYMRLDIAPVNAEL